MPALVAPNKPNTVTVQVPVPQPVQTAPKPQAAPQPAPRPAPKPKPSNISPWHDAPAAMFLPHFAEEQEAAPQQMSRGEKPIRYAKPFSGWISPKGEMHELAEGQDHNDWAGKYLGIHPDEIRSSDAFGKLHNAGWIRVAGAGRLSAQHKITSGSLRSPRTRENLQNFLQTIPHNETVSIGSTDQGGHITRPAHEAIRSLANYDPRVHLNQRAARPRRYGRNDSLPIFKTLLENPHDDAPWGILADSFDEDGKEHAASLMRLIAEKGKKVGGTYGGTYDDRGRVVDLAPDRRFAPPDRQVQGKIHGIPFSVRYYPDHAFIRMNHSGLHAPPVVVAATHEHANGIVSEMDSGRVSRTYSRNATPIRYADHSALRDAVIRAAADPKGRIPLSALLYSVYGQKHLGRMLMQPSRTDPGPHPDKSWLATGKDYFPLRVGLHRLGNDWSVTLYHNDPEGKMIGHFDADALTARQVWNDLSPHMHKSSVKEYKGLEGRPTPPTPKDENDHPSLVLTNAEQRETKPKVDLGTTRAAKPTRNAKKKYGRWRAPAGGVVVRGNYYVGGKLVPEEASGQPVKPKKRKLSQLLRELRGALKFARRPEPVDTGWMEAFHGTRNPDLTAKTLEQKDPGYSGSLGHGIYLGANHETAKFYGDHVIPVHVRFRRPLVIDPEEIGTVVHDGDSILAGESMQPFDIHAHDGEVNEVRDHYDLAGLRRWAEHKGYDGIIMRNMRPSGGGEEMLAFDEKQVRTPKKTKRKMSRNLMDDEAFRRAIDNDPHDDAPKLVYADYLDEHGKDTEAAIWREMAYHKGEPTVHTKGFVHEYAAPGDGHPNDELFEDFDHSRNKHINPITVLSHRGLARTYISSPTLPLDEVEKHGEKVTRKYRTEYGFPAVAYPISEEESDHPRIAHQTSWARHATNHYPYRMRTPRGNYLVGSPTEVVDRIHEIRHGKEKIA